MEPIDIRPAVRPLRATLCFSSLGCGELDLEDVLALAARRGLSAIELRTLGGRNDLPDYFETNYGTPQRLSESVAAFGIKIASLNSSCAAIGATPAELAELVALVPWATALGVPSIRVFDGGERGDAAELTSIGATLDWWRELSLAPNLIIETHDALAQTAALQEFIEKYPGANILWDTYHTWNASGEAPSMTWRRLVGRTRHLHIKDSISKRGYVAPGLGEFPFDDLIEALSLGGFDGVISLEWERYWFPELPPIDEALDGFARVFSPHLSGAFP